MINPLDFPTQEINNLLLVNPKGIIQLALSRLNGKGYSDSEIAEYIANLLGVIMDKNNLVITAKDIISLQFEKKANPVK